LFEFLSKEYLIKKIKAISTLGWIKSVRRAGNDGAVGNTLEKLLGIKENNLPIANAAEWELKGQRSKTTSLITLKHVEPQPGEILPRLLLPLYGWPHKQAGKKHPKSELSFRSTTPASRYTNRGFRIIIDRTKRTIKFDFNANAADISDPSIKAWLETVKSRVGLGPLNPQPYWGFDDLNYLLGTKIKNAFYVIADRKIDGKKEFFHYVSLLILQGYSFEKFLECLEKDVIMFDFDARTHHNHGTKVRIRQNCWPQLYSKVEKIF